VRGLLACLLLAGAATFGGCTRSTGEAFTVQPTDPALAGRFFSAAGETSSLADLYDGRFASGHLLLYRLTTTQRIGGLGGCPSTLTVTNADRTVGFTDTLQTFSAGAFSPIPDLANPKGSAPAVDSACRLIFDRFDHGTDPPSDHLILLDPTQKTNREIYAPAEGKVLGTADWGPGGRIAVFEGTAATEGHPTVATSIVVIEADGAKRLLPPPVDGFGTLQWGASKWIAVSDEANRKTVFLDPDSPNRAELAGWFPLAWSPDGQRLMVTDAATRKTLALVEASDLGKARVVGRAKKAAFFDLVWLPETATAVGPVPSLPRRPDDGD
jgi:hypothetical protein